MPRHFASSAMSYNDKNESISKEEWQNRLENFNFKQADMNKLIMNYLITGTYLHMYTVYIMLLFVVFHFSKLN